jgi:HEAT repeat protein
MSPDLAAVVLGGLILVTSPAARTDGPRAPADGPQPAQAAASDEPVVPPGVSVDRLIEALRQDGAYKLRLQAAVMLGRSGDGRAATPLVEALEKDPQYTVRAACATALANLKEPRAIAPLLTRMGMDPEAFVREEAARALAKFDRAVALERVLSAYTSPYPSVRREVVRYVLPSPTVAAEPVLALALGDVPAVAVLARQAALAIPPPERWRFFASAAQNSEPAVRRGVVEALRHDKCIEAAQIVLDIYERDIEEEEVRAAAKSALRELRDVLPMAQILKDAAPSSEKHTRARALRLLGCLGGAEARGVLVGALEDDDRYVRGIAVMALGELGDVTVLPAVEKLARNPDNERIMHLVNNTLRQLRMKTGNP